MTREQARYEINSRIAELPKAKRRISGHDTYICPFCGNGSGKDGTGISTKDGKRYSCFRGCFTSLDYLDILKMQYNTDKERDIFERYGLMIDDTAAPSRPSAPTAPQPSTPTDYVPYYNQTIKALSESPEAQQYLTGRGISPKTANYFRLGYDSAWKHPKAVMEGKNPPTSPRIIIPTSRHSYLARDIRLDVDPKYKAMKAGTAEIFNAKALKGDAPVFITEGEIDAISIYEAGGQAVALGSTAYIRKFIEHCKNEPTAVPLILSLDNDKAGRKAQAELKAGLEALNITIYEINTAGEHKDPNEHLTTNREVFTALVNSDPAESAKAEAEAAKLNYLATAASNQLEAFKGEIEANAITPATPTGFKELDVALDGGLYPGLYVVGAISSLGKTTFILQIADQIAMKGRDVLIFSLEMSRYELMAKSISRLTFENCNGKPSNALSTRKVLTGERFNLEEIHLVEQCMDIYSQYAQRIYIHEGVGNIGIEQIRAEVKKHISFTGNTPIVIIDYLQIISPHELKATDKQITDKAVLELKRISRDDKTPVIAISSFNRDNYTAPVNLASFKESGAIEYSSDILLGLQLAGMDKLKQSEAKRAETIKQIEDWKATDPRKAQLKVLKNRNGKIGLSLYFDYYPIFNYFKETATMIETNGFKSR